MDDVERQAIEQAIKELEDVYKDAVKYPFLRLPGAPEFKLSKLGGVLKLLDPLRRSQ